MHSDRSRYRDTTTKVDQAAMFLECEVNVIINLSEDVVSIVSKPGNFFSLFFSLSMKFQNNAYN